MADDNPTTPRDDLTADFVRSILDYDPATGVFRWKVPGPGRRPDLIAGYINKANRGYVEIGIDGRTYYAHRLAWLIMTGEWPPHFVDHRFFDRSDNRWDTLRHATPSESQFNRRKQSNNTSGFKGVHKFRNKWMASIGHNRHTEYIGVFHDPVDAARAYDKRARELFGDYAHLNFPNLIGGRTRRTPG